MQPAPARAGLVDDAAVVWALRRGAGAVFAWCTAYQPGAGRDSTT